MPLTIEQLKQGINYWRDTNWPGDFHNAFYQDLAAIQPSGVFNQGWWDQFLPILRAWRATRPRGEHFLTPRAQARFEALGTAWADAVALQLENDIEGVQWEQVSAFPIVAAEIKAVASPVFPSKFCHFLAPRIFPVVDNAAMGNPFPSYEEYFTAGRQKWLDTNAATQNELIALVTKEVGASLYNLFPMKCKVIELCIIGRNKMRANDRLHRTRNPLRGSRAAEA